MRRASRNKQMKNEFINLLLLLFHHLIIVASPRPSPPQTPGLAVPIKSFGKHLFHDWLVVSSSHKGASGDKNFFEAFYEKNFVVPSKLCDWLRGEGRWSVMWDDKLHDGIVYHVDTQR